MFEDLINFIGNASKDEIIKILKDNGVKFKSDIMEDNMNKELEIMKYIKSEMIRVNDECGRLISLLNHSENSIPDLESL